MHDAEVLGEEEGGAVARGPEHRDHDVRGPAHAPEPREPPRELALPGAVAELSGPGVS